MNTPQVFKIVTTVSLIALVASACSTGSGSGTGSGAPTVRFVSPADGANVTIPFDVQVQSSVTLAAPETGEHHVHLYYDTTTPTTDESTYDKLYGTTFKVMRALSPGKHTLMVAVANADHSLAGGSTQTITINVTGSSGGSSGASAAPSPSGY